MLAKSHRLRGKARIQTILKHGDMGKRRHLVMRSLKNTEANSRFAIIVSQKISKSAVKRHRIKRQISEIIRLNIGKIPLSTTLDVIFLPRHSILEASYKDIEMNLKHLIQTLQ